MRTYDFDEVANRLLASGDGVSLLKHLYRDELEKQQMFDKQAQRARAQSLTDSLAAQGLVPPKLPVPAPTPRVVVATPEQAQQDRDAFKRQYGKSWPFPTGLAAPVTQSPPFPSGPLDEPSVPGTKRKAARFVKDAADKTLHIGDKVACSQYMGSALLIGVVTGFTPKMVRLEVNKPSYDRRTRQRRPTRSVVKNRLYIVKI